MIRNPVFVALDLTYTIILEWMKPLEVIKDWLVSAPSPTLNWFLFFFSKLNYIRNILWND